MLKENTNLFRLSLRGLLIIGTSVTFLLTGCQTGALKDQVMMLSEKQTFLARERDSLQRLFDVKTREVDTINKNYNTLSIDFKTLTTKNKSLQSGYYSRGVQLKKVTEENAVLSTSLSDQITKNDSLQNELRYLQEKIAAIDKAMADAQSNNARLAGTIKQQEDKIITDSIAEAQKPVLPEIKDESGFVSISEIGEGFGVGQNTGPYSKHLLSFTTIAAYKVNNSFLTGIGTGVHVYNGGTMIPLYLDVRYTFNHTIVAPFIIADGGILFNLNDFGSSGLFINPALGLEMKLAERFSLNLSTGVLVKQPPEFLKSSFLNYKIGLVFGGK